MRIPASFSQIVKAAILSNGEPNAALAYAKGQNWIMRPIEQYFQRAAVGSLGTDDFAPATPSEVELFQYLWPQQIIGQLSGAQFVPGDVRMITQTGAFVSYWVGERKNAPITKTALTGETIRQLKTVGVSVQTKELAESSDPDSTTLIGAGVGKAIVFSMDDALVDPNNTGVAGVKPASITSSGTNNRASTGSSLAQIDADVEYAAGQIVLNGGNLRTTSVIMSPRTWLHLAMKRGSGGALAYPGLSSASPTFFGMPVVVSNALPGSGSPSATIIVLVDATELLIVDDRRTDIAISRQASVLMRDDQQSPEEQSLVSLFQTESVAIKAVRYCNWKMSRSGLVSVITGVTY